MAQLRYYMQFKCFQDLEIPESAQTLLHTLFSAYLLSLFFETNFVSVLCQCSYLCVPEEQAVASCE